jgi:hypothetical protein
MEERRRELAWLYVFLTHSQTTEDEILTFGQVIRGNSVVMLEALERIGGDDRRGDR